MRAAILRGKRDMVVEEIPTPTAEPGEIIVKIKYAGICGSDLHLFVTGLLPPDVIMGHECSGVIVELGDSVEGWSVGEKVAVHGSITCGQCPSCLAGRPNICTSSVGVGFGQLTGAYAEFMKVYPGMLLKIPQDINLQDIALVDPFTTAARGIMLSGFRMRETALVVGAGPIGLCTIQQLKMAKASFVAATEPVEKRARLAKEWGADIVLDPKDNVVAELEQHTHDIGVDYVFECVGIPATTHESFNLVRHAGKVVLVGVCMEEMTTQPLFWMLKEVSMQTSMGFTRSEFEATLDLMCKGAFKTDGFVSETISLAQLPGMFERLLSPNEEIKVLVEFPD